MNDTAHVSYILFQPFYADMAAIKTNDTPLFNPSSFEERYQKIPTYNLIEITSHITKRDDYPKTNIFIGDRYKVITNPRNKWSKVACKITRGKNIVGFIPETTHRLAQLLYPLLKDEKIELYVEIITKTPVLIKHLDNTQIEEQVLPCKYILNWLYGEHLAKQRLIDQLKRFAIPFEQKTV